MIKKVKVSAKTLRHGARIKGEIEAARLRKDAERRIEILEVIAIDFHWMARRYADNRQSYVTGLFNDHVRQLIKMGIKLNPTGDNIIWARDAQGRTFDGLSDDEATVKK